MRKDLTVERFGGSEMSGVVEWLFRSEVRCSISGVCVWIQRAKISFMESAVWPKEVLIETVENPYSE